MMRLDSKLPWVSTSIFTVMSKLAVDHGAINLSQGFPDYDCPPELISLVEKHLRAGHNQYAPMAGVPALREAVAEKINLLHGAGYDAENEITITAGATQAIFTALACILKPGDEVIVFEPVYDSYIPTIETFGARAVRINLNPLNYAVDWTEVRNRVTERTRMILINTPHNPTATVLSEADLQELEAITAGTPILVMSDEVYEHLIFDGSVHQSAARFPGLRERTFIVASFGKIFHTTGWKIGYCAAPHELMREFRKVHQFNVFSVNTPMQYAAAEYLSIESSWRSLPGFFTAKRDLFISLMRKTPFELLPCQGTYFLAASYKSISEESDVNFCQKLTEHTKVAAIPLSVFYTEQTDLKRIRFCFAKKQETLEKAAERLAKYG